MSSMEANRKSQKVFPLVEMAENHESVPLHVKTVPCVMSLTSDVNFMV